jgi:hypothetical protein
MAAFVYLLAVVIDTPAPPAAAAPEAPPHIYLHPPTDGCDSRAASDEVVVCANKDADAKYRLQPTDPHQYDDKPVRAEMKLFGDSTLKAHVDEVGLGGATSKRAMITFTMPF